MARSIFDLIQSLVVGIFNVIGYAFKPFKAVGIRLNAIREGNKKYTKWAKKENQRYRRGQKLNDEIS